MTWLTKKSKKIHQNLLEKGVLVTAPKNGNVVPKGVTENSFVLGTRTLHFFHPQNLQNTSPHPYAPDAISLEHTCSFLEKIIKSTSIQSFITVKEHDVLTPQDRKKADTAKRLGQSWGQRESPYIFSYRDTNHHTEIFLPIVYKDPLNPSRELGSYIFPWSSANTNKLNFKNIKRYVTAGCLGGTLIGYDQKGGEQLLIKHDLDFFDNQVIEDVSDSSESPYDIVLFHEFEKMACLIRNLGENQDLFYHIPYYDYILFGIKLYIQGRFTCEAFEKFIEHIFIRKERHEYKIKEISDKYNIKLTIKSPFSTIFQDKPTNDLQTFLQIIFSRFDDLLKDRLKKPDPGKESEIEKKLVSFCLNKLLNEKENKEHQQVWNDFISAKKINNILSLEDLFKTANAVIIGLASMNQPNNTVSSILPLSEKPISIEYANHISEVENQKDQTFYAYYAHTINLTILDPVVCYSPGKKNSGLLFYNHTQEDTLLELLDEEMFNFMSKNIKAFALAETPSISISNIISSPELRSVPVRTPLVGGLTPPDHVPAPLSQNLLNQNDFAEPLAIGQTSFESSLTQEEIPPNHNLYPTTQNSLNASLPLSPKNLKSALLVTSFA